MLTRQRALAGLIVASGILLIVGAVLPWELVHIPGRHGFAPFDDVYHRGPDAAAGRWALVAGSALVVLGVVRLWRRWDAIRRVPLLIATVGAFVIGFGVADGWHDGLSPGLATSDGVGVWVTLAGVGLSLIATLGDAFVA